jgi:hypothetical protein
VASPLVEQSIQPTGVPDQPGVGPTRLQDVMSDIKALANKVGGLDQLAEIINTLKQSKE